MAGTAHVLKKRENIFIFYNFYPDLDQAPLSIGKFIGTFNSWIFLDFFNFPSDKPEACPNLSFPQDRDQVFDMNFGGPKKMSFLSRQCSRNYANGCNDK